MALPNVSRDQLLDAIRQFDAASTAYNWHMNRYALFYDGHHYPPKVIVSIATGRGVDTFSGGVAGANGYLEKRGFTIIDLRRN
jgi:hypothetical protein